MESFLCSVYISISALFPNFFRKCYNVFFLMMSQAATGRSARKRIV